MGWCDRVIVTGRSLRVTDIAGTNQTDSGAVQALSLPQGTSAFRPAGMIFRSIFPAPARFIRILQRPETYDSIIPDLVRGGGANLPPQTGLHDPLVSQIALTIASGIDQGFLDQMLADTTPGARAQTRTPRRAGCSVRSRRAPQSGSCRTPGTAARRLRAGQRSARPGNSPPRPSCRRARAPGRSVAFASKRLNDAA